MTKGTVEEFVRRGSIADGCCSVRVDKVEDTVGSTLTGTGILVMVDGRIELRHVVQSAQLVQSYQLLLQQYMLSSMTDYHTFYNCNSFVTNY